MTSTPPDRPRSAEEEPFTIDGTEHERGNAECGPCWDPPTVHEECGGLVHSQFGDENWDGYWVYSRCDRCGEDPA